MRKRYVQALDLSPGFGDLESTADQSKVGQMAETKELVEAYKKMLWVMYKEEFASQYEKMEKFSKLLGPVFTRAQYSLPDDS